ncbi:hypothetical protein Dimus_024480 [Dionaea muscipula]
MARYAAALSPPPPISTTEHSTSPIAGAAGGYSYQTNSDAVLSSSTSLSSSSPAENLSTSILVTVLILATAVIVSASVYLLIRLIRRHCRRQPHTDAVDSLRRPRHHHNNSNRSRHHQHHHRHNTSRRVSPEENGSAIDSLPLFTFDSITGTGRNNSSTIDGDCAVCLSKFEPHDQLRLLPICCHAFHSSCIDAWLVANQTCPLCRTPIFVSETEILRKILMTSTTGAERSDSFRIELGSFSRRRNPSDPGGDNRRSYSIGSFDYVIEDALSEVIVPSARPGSDNAVGDKNEGARPEVEAAPEPPGRSIAMEVGSGGRSWLREYVDRWASFSLSSSFRGSGRFFSGSSRRTELAGVRESDLEASRLGDEITEMFRWLSGV